MTLDVSGSNEQKAVSLVVVRRPESESEKKAVLFRKSYVLVVEGVDDTRHHTSTSTQFGWFRRMDLTIETNH